jgi:hypothetical protein
VARAVDVRVVAVFVSYSTCAVEIVMPRAFSSGLVDLVVGRERRAARLASTFVIAAVSDVLPWSTCPIVRCCSAASSAQTSPSP